jgi:anti-sigma B factor antagonist
MELQITQELLSGECAMVKLSGRLNAVTALELKERLKGLVEEGYVQLVVDLADVPFIDSSGLAALVSGLKATRQANGALKLAGLNEQARTVFRITRLERVFELYLDATAALEAVRGQGLLQAPHSPPPHPVV